MAVGGGPLTVQQAMATSSTGGLPIATTGTAGFMLTGWQNSQLLPGSSGFVYWPAFSGTVLTGMLTAPPGEHRLIGYPPSP